MRGVKRRRRNVKSMVGIAFLRTCRNPPSRRGLRLLMLIAERARDEAAHRVPSTVR